MKRRNLAMLLFIMMSVPFGMAASRYLDLDSCRSLAVANNKDLRTAEMQIQSAHYKRKSAFTNYLPKVSATGIYMHTDKEISLLNDEQKGSLSGIGDALSVPMLNSVGQGLVNALRTDTRNIAATAIMLSQPVYMGGKIRAYNNITRYAENIARDMHNLKYQELIVDVDETYWTIISLTARQKLAQSYLNLVETLDGDIRQMIDAGFATKADGLSVKVKVNEAKVAIIQVDNGIQILKQRLCQLCGIPIDTSIELADENHEADPSEDMLAEDSAVWKSRPELSALATSIMIADEKVKIARSEFLPNIALTGGYFATYPSVFNSFEKKFKGTWNIGVAVNIPILTWGDRKYKVKEAKADAAAARFSFEETREKVELQVSQSLQRITEAREKHIAALSSQEAADENLRYATLGLKEGTIPVSNVIEAQTAWLSAKTVLISSDIDLRLAHLYLKKSLGTIK